MKLQAPYLEGIQTIPGDTPGEKFKWISKFICDHVRAREESVEIIESAERIPCVLVPLIKVEAARILRRYDAITEALKSEDATIVNRALQASWYFDGTNQAIVNPKYFAENLFPYVSLRTRSGIVKSLGNQLGKKNAPLAEEFFDYVADTYGTEQAMPLIPACGENFVLESAVKRKLTLSARVVKLLYKKNPGLTIRYLKMKLAKTGGRVIGSIPLSEYTDIVVKLVKKHFEDFIELFEMEKNWTLSFKLSKKSSDLFVKKGKEYLLKEPKRYIDILQLDVIDEETMKRIFPKLMPERSSKFDADRMLEYLTNYPEERRYELLSTSYRERYGKDFLEDPDNVNTTLMQIMPTDVRIKMARIQMKKRPSYDRSYLTSWRCYLGTDEALKLIKEDMLLASDVDARISFAKQMIFTCKLNKDDDALLQILTYLKDRHRNERSFFLEEVLMFLVDQYDLSKLSKAHWDVLYEMIRRGFVKEDLTVGSSSTERLLEAAIHFRLLNNLPIDPVINMFVESKILRWTTCWNILQDYPEYERKCLNACLEVVEKKIDSDDEKWTRNRSGILEDLVTSMYDFNKRHVKSKVSKDKSVERMSLKDYPWLEKAIKDLIDTNDPDEQYILNRIKALVHKNDKELHRSWWLSTEKGFLADVGTGEATRLLKIRPEKILENWQEYSKRCLSVGFSRREIAHFVRATRWYKDIPLKFAEEFFAAATVKKDPWALTLLAELVHGDTLAKIIEPLIPTEKTIDIESESAKENYSFVTAIPTSMKIANPPVPLELVSRMCQGDYLSSALVALTNVSRRTSLTKVIPFARSLVDTRVALKKHGIRQVVMVASLNDTSDFLLSQWKTETHHSIREVLFDQIKKLLWHSPGPQSWVLFKNAVESVTVKDEGMINNLTQLHFVPNEYIAEFIELLFRMTDRLKDLGLKPQSVSDFSQNFLSTINNETHELVPQELFDKVFRKFLFHDNSALSDAACDLAAFCVFQAKDDQLPSRITTITNILEDVVKKHWDTTDPKSLRYHPVNYATCVLLKFVAKKGLINNDKPNSRKIIDAFLTTFLKILKPEMAPYPYINLIYVKERLVSKTPKEFGVQVARQVRSLVETFDPFLLPLMASILAQICQNSQSFVDYTTEEVLMEVTEAMAEEKCVQANAIAAYLLPKRRKRSLLERFDQIVEKIRKCDDRGVNIYLNATLNETELW